MKPVVAATALGVWLCTMVAALALDAARLPLVTVLQIKTTAHIDQTVAAMLRDELKALAISIGRLFDLNFDQLRGTPLVFLRWRRRWCGTSQA